MLRRSLAFAALYAVAIVIGRATVQPETGLAMFWPAAGVGVVWALRSTTRRELATALTLTATLAAVGNAVTGIPYHAAAVLGLANASVGLVVTLLLGRSVGSGERRRGQADVHRLADFYRLLGAAAAGTAVSAGIGMVGLVLAQGSVAAGTGIAWWLRNLSAVVVIAAPALTAATWYAGRSGRAVALETSALLGLAAVALVVHATQGLPLAFLYFGFAIWAGLRLPLPVAAAVGGATAVGALLVVRVSGDGPFASIPDELSQTVVLQAFMAMLVLVTMVVATVRTQLGDLVADLSAAVHESRAAVSDLRTIAEAIPTALFVLEGDGSLIFSNAAGRRFLGSHQSAGTRLDDAVQKWTVEGDDLPADERPSVRVLRGETVDRRRLLARDADGSTRVVAVSGVPLEASNGSVDRAVLLWHDVTDDHLHAEELRLERTRSDLILEDAPHGIVVLDENGLILSANRAMGDLFDCSPDSLVGVGCDVLVQADPESALDYVRRTVQAAGQLVDGEWEVRTSGGRDLTVATTSRVVVGRGGSPEVVVNVVDVSERRRFEQRLTHLATHDALTGLPNRRLFDEILGRQQEVCARYGPRGSLLLVDLDHFKEVNDTLGHAAGDHLIASVADLLRRSVRSSDTVARLGGDEFAVILPESDLAAARTVAAAVVETVRTHCESLGGPYQRVTASIGVVAFADAASRGGDALALADMLMYDAKDAGRDGFAVLDEARDAVPLSGARMEWRTKLEQAVENDGFEIHLQPILEMSTGRVVAAEALLRLRDGADLVMPGRFMDIAERTGIAPRIDAWVLGRCVPLLADLQVLCPDFVLEVNLSAHSIGDPEIERILARALASHGVDPSTLVLEVTETAAVRDVPAARAFADRLSRSGTRFALDDFGAGYGSFYYLKHLVFDQVKIDGEFVVDAHRSPLDEKILRSIVGVARTLGKTTIAEFVESPEALEVVRGLDVDYAQGYHIGRPVPVAEFVAAHLGVRPFAAVAATGVVEPA